jgi:hypothetical protein
MGDELMRVQVELLCRGGCGAYCTALRDQVRSTGLLIPMCYWPPGILSI